MIRFKAIAILCFAFFLNLNHYAYTQSFITAHGTPKGYYVLLAKNDTELFVKVVNIWGKISHYLLYNHDLILKSSVRYDKSVIDNFKEARYINILKTFVWKGEPMFIQVRFYTRKKKPKSDLAYVELIRPYSNQEIHIIDSFAYDRDYKKSIYYMPGRVTFSKNDDLILLSFHDRQYAINRLFKSTTTDNSEFVEETGQSYSVLEATERKIPQDNMRSIYYNVYHDSILKTQFTQELPDAIAESIELKKRQSISFNFSPPVRLDSTNFFYVVDAKITDTIPLTYNPNTGGYGGGGTVESIYDKAFVFCRNSLNNTLWIKEIPKRYGSDLGGLYYLFLQNEKIILFTAVGWYYEIDHTGTIEEKHLPGKARVYPLFAEQISTTRLFCFPYIFTFK